MLDSGNINLTLPYGVRSKMFPTTLKRLRNDLSKSGSIADLVVKQYGHYRQASHIQSCKKCRTKKLCDNNVIYQFQKLGGHFRSVPRALYIHLESYS